MKKFFTICLCLLLLSSNFIFPSYANDEQLSVEQMRTSLVSQGLFIGYVNSMSDSQVIDLYNRLENGSSEIITVTKTASMETEQGATTYGVINSNNFHLTVGLIVDYEENGRINKAAGLVMWQWEDGHPAGRRDDLVHIYWEPSCFTMSTEGFGSADFYKLYVGDYIEYNLKSSPAIATTSDMVVYSNVYSGFGSDRGGWCVFNMVPAKPMYKGNNFSTPIAVTYYHNKSMVPFVNDFSYTISNGGLEIEFSDILTDTATNSYAFLYS